MMKKHLVESVVPLLVELKAMLTEARHPLLGQLMVRVDDSCCCITCFLLLHRCCTVRC